jgi:Mrp family chromosome partitioning ATPase/capsular polysaccharide biosynthesis protein
LLAGIISSLRTPLYRATAQVLLRPNDPTEQLNPNNVGQNLGIDPDRYVSGQRNIVESAAVAQEASKTLGGLDFKLIDERTTVVQGGQSNVLNISAVDPEPAQARDLANAVARGYIENRRQAAVAGLEQAAKDIADRLGPLEATIAQLDSRIGEGSTVAGATSQLVAPATPGATTPTRPATQVEGATPSAGPASTTEALKAARYAAAVQYETLFSRQQELLVNISLKRGEAELIEEATEPTEPESPKPVRDGALGVFVGLLFGVGFSFVREQLNDRLRSADEVAEISGLPLLARLPLDDETAKSTGGVVVVDRPNSPLAEAVRSLRTSIQYLAVDQPIKLIVVTSSLPGEGKSLVAANLATMFAQADYRTVLVSADLRRSSIDELFGKHAASPGLTGVIAPMTGGTARSGANGNGNRGAGHEVASSLSAVVKTPVANLLLIPAGPTPPNPADLLGSRRMTTLLTDWSNSADVVILDTPPLLAVTDAAVLAARSDGVVLVAAVNETRRDALKQSVAILEGTGARLLGVVANKVSRSAQGDYYYAGYYGPEPAERTRIGPFGRRRPVAKRS